MSAGDVEATAAVHAWRSIEADHPAEHASRQLVKGERMMVARYVLDPGFDIPPHAHHNEQISVVVEGHLVFRVGTVGSDEIREVEVTAGEVIVLPPFVPHGARTLERSVVYDLFSPPSEQTGIDQG